MPHRTKLLDLIADYRLRFPREEETTSRLERFVRKQSAGLTWKTFAPWCWCSWAQICELNAAMFRAASGEWHRMSTSPSAF